jgi:signal transduction histidine kinase
VNLSNLVNTATFRLSILYISVFSLSVLLLGAFVYWVTKAALLDQLDRSIEIEAASLASEHRSLGVEQLTERLRELENSGAWRGFRYRLATHEGVEIAGTLGKAVSRKIGTKPGWAKLSEGRDTRGGSVNLKAFTIGLDGGYWLTVARSATSVNDAEKVIVEVFGWALGATLLIGTAGGLFVSSRFLDRIEGIGSAARAIIDGNYRERMPVSGTNDDLDRLAQTLNIMLDRIAALMESLRQVSNDIAHDLRTPLSRMRQRLEAALAMDLGNAQLREAITTAISDTDDILATFSALLRIAQIEAGTRRSAFVSVDLSSLVGEIAEAYAPSLQDEGSCLKCRIDDGLRIVGDRELLTQLVANLIENAERHTPAGTQIGITVSTGSESVLLVVEDNGPGVPAETRERLFERFYRLERSRTTPGSGLGLSLVKSVCDLHGAVITLADNAPGLRVTIRFAAAPARAAG